MLIEEDVNIDDLPCNNGLIGLCWFSAGKGEVKLD